MAPPVDRLLAYGGRILLEQTHSLIALIAQDGGLVEWNPTMGHMLALVPGAESLAQLLDSHSRQRILTLVEQAVHDQKAGPAILHFVDGPAGLPRSYHCQLVTVPAGGLIFFAEPIAPLDQQSAEQYIRLTNDLSIVTRSLQKARFELERKQRLLEDALAQLVQIANIDDLTQLLNRRSIMLRLSEETDRSRRYRSAVSILLIDIDHFKQINDRYGHPVGDQVLHACAALLKRSIRSTDHLGRYGGEEFLAILPMTDGAAATDLAERLRWRVEHEPFTAAGTISFSATISIGIAEFTPDEDGAELLVAHADSALYQAKAQGRNRYALWRS